MMVASHSIHDADSVFDGFDGLKSSLGNARIINEDAIPISKLPLEISDRVLQNDNGSPFATSCDITRLQEVFGNGLTNVNNPRYSAMEWISSTTQDECPYDEPTLMQRFAMASFYYALGGDGWNSSIDWLSSSDVCEWEGVTCNDDGSIDVLKLPANNLAGDLPGNVIAQLSDIRELRLANNGITGKVPNGLYDLTNLEVVGLSNNQLTGSISDRIGELTQMRDFRSAQNSLSGKIPETFANLENLEALALHINDITGAVPEALCSMDSINILETDCASPPDPPLVFCPEGCCTTCFSADDRNEEVVPEIVEETPAPSVPEAIVTNTQPPTVPPTPSPTKSPSNSPIKPTGSPTKTQTTSPTISPTKSPSKNPTPAPSSSPSLSFEPTPNPSKSPTLYPTQSPTTGPTGTPSKAPSTSPTISHAPSSSPSSSPSARPSASPSDVPSLAPTPYASYFESTVLITIANMPGKMDEVAISVFERVMMKFLHETFPDEEIYEKYDVNVTKLDVISQTISLPGTDNIFVISGNRTDVLGGSIETNLLIGLEVGGDVHPYNPGDHFIFANYVLNGLEEHYFELATALKASGDDAFAQIPTSNDELRSLNIGNLSYPASVTVIVFICLGIVLCCGLGTWCFCASRRRRLQQQGGDEILKANSMDRDEETGSRRKSEREPILPSDGRDTPLFPEIPDNNDARRGSASSRKYSAVSSREDRRKYHEGDETSENSSSSEHRHSPSSFEDQNDANAAARRPLVKKSHVDENNEENYPEEEEEGTNSGPRHHSNADRESDIPSRDYHDEESEADTLEDSVREDRRRESRGSRGSESELHDESDISQYDESEVTPHQEGDSLPPEEYDTEEEEEEEELPPSRGRRSHHQSRHVKENKYDEDSVEEPPPPASRQKKSSRRKSKEKYEDYEEESMEDIPSSHSKSLQKDSRSDHSLLQEL